MKKLISQIKSFAGLITAVVVISGATKFVDWRSTKNQTEVRSQEFEQVMDTLSVMQDAIWYNNVQLTQQGQDLQGIHDTLKGIDKENKQQSSDIRTLIWAQRNENDFTQDQLREIMDEMLKKNARLEKISPEGDLIPSEWLLTPSTDLRTTSPIFNSSQ
jgi:hypothetical protein